MLKLTKSLKSKKQRNMTLSKFFDYIPNEIHYIMSGAPDMAQSLQDKANSISVIKNIVTLHYIEPKVNTTTMKALRREMAVCFLTFSPLGLSVLRHHQSDDTLPIPREQVQQSYSIIKLTGEYPVYVKDRDGYAYGLRGKESIQLFNADMNKWMKHALDR